MLRQQAGLVGRIGVGSGVDDSTATKFGLGLEVACHGLGRGLVRTAPDRLPLAILVGVGDVPRRVLALEIALALVDTGHRVRLLLIPGGGSRGRARLQRARPRLHPPYRHYSVSSRGVSLWIASR